MSESNPDGLERRTVLKRLGATGVAATGFAATGLSGVASATGERSDVSVDPTDEESRREFFEKHTADLRERLSEEGYLPDAGVDQFDLGARIDDERTVSAALDEVGYRPVGSVETDAVLSISHNTDDDRMVLFAKPNPAESHAVVEAGDDRTILAASTGSGSSYCYSWQTCDYAACGCTTGGDYMGDPIYHKNHGKQITRECCLDGFFPVCRIVSEADCRTCSSEGNGEC